MIIIRRFFLMLQFFTTIPIRKSFDVTEKDYGKGLVFAPLIGMLTGFILYGLYLLAGSVFSLETAPIFIFIFYILLTGGLHLDGLGDTFDGLFSGKPVDRMIEIMRDSRLGTNALLVISAVFILNVFFLFQFDQGKEIMTVIVLFPAAGRIGSLLGCSMSKYASEKGLGKSFVDYCGSMEAIIGTVLIFTITFLIFDFKGIILIGISLVTAVVFTLLLRRKLKGVTGDILGAICELNQTVFILAAYLLFNR